MGVASNLCYRIILITLMSKTLMSYFVILSSLLEINSYKNTTLLFFFPIFWIIIKIIYELFFYKAFLKYA